MKFSEFRETDVEDAYSEFVSVSDAKERGILPEKFHEVFPNECECGSEFIITKNLKTIKCVDPFCPIKVAKRMANMFANFGAKGLAEGNCAKILTYCKHLKLFEIPTHTEILKHYNNDNLKYLLGDSLSYNLFAVCEQIVNGSYTLESLVSKLAIPEFKVNSSVLRDIPTFEDLVNKFSDGSITMYMSARGFYSPMKINNLRIHLFTILHALMALKKPLITRVNRDINSEKVICITGSVSADGIRFRNREMFPAYCNEICNINGAQIFTVRNTKARETCDYIIADSESNNESYLVGLRRGNLMTAQQYVNHLREELKEWIEKNTKQ